MRLWQIVLLPIFGFWLAPNPIEARGVSPEEIMENYPAQPGDSFVVQWWVNADGMGLIEPYGIYELTGLDAYPRDSDVVCEPHIVRYFPSRFRELREYSINYREDFYDQNPFYTPIVIFSAATSLPPIALHLLEEALAESCSLDNINSEQ